MPLRSSYVLQENQSKNAAENLTTIRPPEKAFCLSFLKLQKEIHSSSLSPDSVLEEIMQAQSLEELLGICSRNQEHYTGKHMVYAIQRMRYLIPTSEKHIDEREVRREYIYADALIPKAVKAIDEILAPLRSRIDGFGEAEYMQLFLPFKNCYLRHLERCGEENISSLVNLHSYEEPKQLLPTLSAEFSTSSNAPSIGSGSLERVDIPSVQDRLYEMWMREVLGSVEKILGSFGRGFFGTWNTQSLLIFLGYDLLGNRECIPTVASAYFLTFLGLRNLCNKDIAYLASILINRIVSEEDPESLFDLSVMAEHSRYWKLFDYLSKEIISRLPVMHDKEVHVILENFTLQSHRENRDRSLELNLLKPLFYRMKSCAKIDFECKRNVLLELLQCLVQTPVDQPQLYRDLSQSIMHILPKLGIDELLFIGCSFCSLEIKDTLLFAGLESLCLGQMTKEIGGVNTPYIDDDSNNLIWKSLYDLINGFCRVNYSFKKLLNDFAKALEEKTCPISRDMAQVLAWGCLKTKYDHPMLLNQLKLKLLAPETKYYHAKYFEFSEVQQEWVMPLREVVLVFKFLGLNTEPLQKELETLQIANCSMLPKDIAEFAVVLVAMGLRDIRLLDELWEKAMAQIKTVSAEHLSIILQAFCKLDYLPVPFPLSSQIKRLIQEDNVPAAMQIFLASMQINAQSSSSSSS